MCERLADLRGALQAYAAAFEPAEYGLVGARSVLAEAAVIEKAAADLKARAAGRIADLAPSRQGRRQAARDLARLSGSGLRPAEEAIETQRRLAQLPKTAAAARRGELSPAQAQAVAAGASADASAEEHLLEVARTRSVAELAEESARICAAADRDAEHRRRRLFERRSLRHWLDAEGNFRMDLRHTPEDGARLLSFLTPFIDEVRRRARAEGRHERADALAADGLLAMAEAAYTDADRAPADRAPADQADPTEADPTDPDPTDHDADDGAPDADAADQVHSRSPVPTGTGTDAAPAPAGAPRPTDAGRRPRVPAKVIVRVDLGALLRGYPTRGETCEIVGIGPVAVSAVTDLICTGDPFLAAVVTDGERLTGAVHLGRRPRALQVTALEWLYPSCAVAGCAARSFLEFDHREDWARTHMTVLDLIDRLCHRHHAQKTNEGWALVEGTGKRAFVAPDDPRHPRHTNRPPPGRRTAGLDPEAPPAA